MNQKMHALIGWGLAVAAIASGYALYGLPGAAMGITMVVFWMLLQFTRVMRAMRIAGQAPVGLVPSAVMLNARLHAGMRLIDIIQITRSLGEKLADEPETFAWRDESGASVQVQLEGGRVRHWTLTRRDPPEPA